MVTINKKIVTITSLFFALLLCIEYGHGQETRSSNPNHDLQIRFETEKSVVLLKNDHSLIPLQNLKDTKIAFVSSFPKDNPMGKMLDNYAKIFHYGPADIKDPSFPKSLVSFDVVIFAFRSGDDDGLLPSMLKLNNLVLAYFDAPITGSPKNVARAKSVIYAQDSEVLSQKYVAQLIFGGFAARGALTSDIPIGFKKGDGLKTLNQIRLKYTIPEEVGMDSRYIDSKVDSIMSHAIVEHSFPGATLLVAKNNKVIFKKSYGYLTYDSLVPVKSDDLYDLASVTKVMGALPALMKLYEIGKLRLDVPFSNYWKSWRHRKDKKDLTLREILAHQAGLNPYFIFLNDVLKDGKVKKRFVHNHPSSRFESQAYDSIFIKSRFNRKMYREIKRSKVLEEKKYLYSGTAFLIFPELITELSGQPYPEYLKNEFYAPLGSYTLGFKPATKHFPNTIVPTEIDTLFRKTLTHGWVHDENAALLGGVSGNAGLFATADDLAKMMQMYMQNGMYGGERYFYETTIKEFTKVQYPENDNRRGLGFDKPLLNNAELPLSEAYPAPEVSPESFGHSGFTGTFVWADPENQLVFIFLSNRVYPTRKNSNIYKLNVRSSLQQVFYKAQMAQ
ncbi:beta-lactamase family protein [Flavobacteriaceae bacterium F89]|uniref:Beta-lactamase family protein n=1 Tax=Cerina litoralis TaxID=2874477 RepID=A0AAE3EV59_9FLAO|nr:serine hydrolase [Cerina litoralis]MCG2460878.1 beta-lactamase family protein [Cerina litoralis]